LLSSISDAGSTPAASTKVDLLIYI
jgi:hypothetical protein